MARVLEAAARRPSIRGRFAHQCRRWLPGGDLNRLADGLRAVTLASAEAGDFGGRYASMSQDSVLAQPPLVRQLLIDAGNEIGADRRLELIKRVKAQPFDEITNDSTYAAQLTPMSL